MTIIIEFNDTVAEGDLFSPTPVIGVFDFIDHIINTLNGKIIIHIADISKKKAIEEWLIDHHRPLLVCISIKSVEVSDVIPKYSAYISSRAIRFTNFKDIERYFI